MPSLRNGSIHLFRLAGVDLFLHWSWFLVAAIEIQARQGRYTSIVWNIAEYLALFLIVLMHEFGHALACRQTGGTANRIVLWPLGGVAYVDPPQRPGAMLWSIAAGPLVNVVLLPILFAVWMFAKHLGWSHSMHDAYIFTRMIFGINLGLLIFNILPVYPLDGGKILWSLLWFPLGRASSLMAATIIGLLGIVGFIVLAVFTGSKWTGLIAIYMLINCWGSLQQARILMRQEKRTLRPGFSCPSCHKAPPLGPLWKCGKCEQPFDTFESGGVCPHCAQQYPTTMCGYCERQFPISEWVENKAYASTGFVNGGSSGL